MAKKNNHSQVKLAMYDTWHYKQTIILNELGWDKIIRIIDKMTENQSPQEKRPWKLRKNKTQTYISEITLVTGKKQLKNNPKQSI